jgi:ubiquinone/menaquinone biosynthesis C-methylase UbiE
MGVPPLTPLAAATLRVGEPERALEVGCGEGDGALFLAREFPRARVRGVDSSAASIRRAQARVGLDPEGRIAFKVGEPGALPFPDGLFDLVALTGARAAPAELARVLRPGGHLIVARVSPPLLPLGLVEKLLWRRLSRRGIELVEAAAMGNGSFSVGRLGGSEPAGEPN